MSRRIKLTLAYDGTNYNGWQVQARPQGVKTIQGILEEKLKLLTKEEIKVVAAGRTDAGVHALGQVVHFDTNSTIPTERFPQALLSVLPWDIVPLAAEEVDENFHARYSARWKTYRYTIDTGPMPHVFWRRFAYHCPHPLDRKAMARATEYLLGEHDFRSFCASGSSAKNFVRTIAACRWKEEGQLLMLEITGNGFLYNMVRIIMGTLLEIGKGKLKPEAMGEIIAARDRKAAGPTAPAHGLCLLKVEY